LFLKLSLLILAFHANSKKRYEISADFGSSFKMRLHFEKAPSDSALFFYSPQEAQTES
jgi:hypothetical protein